MDSVKFCQVAPLLGAYHGAVAGWIAEKVKDRPVEQERREAAFAPATAAAPSRPVEKQLASAGATMIPPTQAAVMLSPMSDLFSFATSGGE